jgi:hypothetical protein
MSANRNDVLRKLEQIEESAQYALLETPSKLGKQHLKLIIGLAKYLATEIELSGQ